MRSFWILLLIVGMLTAILSILSVAVGALGFAGVLADAGPAENRRLGIQAFTIAAWLGVISTISFVFSEIAKRFDKRLSVKHGHSVARPSVLSHSNWRRRIRWVALFVLAVLLLASAVI